VDDLGQLIFVVLFILFGLISSSKKKSRPKPRVREIPPSEDGRPLPTEVPGYADKMVRPKRALAEELLAVLQGQPEPESELVVVLPEVDDEACSVETLEPAGAETHKRFRERYVDVVLKESPDAVEETATPRPYAIKATRPYLVEEATTPQPYAVHSTSKRKKQLTRSELRHAFVMKEVLGPPKALE
jgi:hypothetical protein